MGVNQDLPNFIKHFLGEQTWEEFCNTIESSAALLSQGFAKEDYVGKIITTKTLEVLGKLSLSELEIFQNLLDRDQGVKVIMSDALQKAIKEHKGNANSPA